MTEEILEEPVVEETAPQSHPAGESEASESQDPGKSENETKSPKAKPAKAVKLVEPRLKTEYKKTVAKQLMEQYKYANVHQIPNLTKIVVNMGVGDAAKDSKFMAGAIADLAAITGQKPRTNKAKKSIAQFKLREGQIIGANSTLRGARMWEFLDHVLSLAIPQVRDFRGLSPKQFDGHGNYTFGFNEQVVFVEIDQNNIDHQRGMDITIVTTAKTDDEGRSLLKLLGFPFAKRKGEE